MAKKKYYAVKRGVTPGIYFTWADCKKQIDGFSGAVYKGFETITEAETFIGGEIAEQKRRIEEDVTIAEDGQAVAYVDGSYNLSSGEYSCGVVFFFDGKEEHFSEKGTNKELASMRNVAGEILGAQRAMERSVEIGARSLKIYHDYQGIASWCLGEWKTNKEGTKAYKAYFDSIGDVLHVTFVKVKGHSGNKYNDLADQLAKQEIF